MSANKKQSVTDQILLAIDSLRYGSIEIVVHEGRITQIEKREKVRFQDTEKPSSISKLRE